MMVRKNIKNLLLAAAIFLSATVGAEEVEPEQWVLSAQAEFGNWYSEVYQEFTDQNGEFQSEKEQAQFREEAWSFFINNRKQEIDALLGEATSEELLLENTVQASSSRISDRIRNQILKSGVPAKALDRALKKMSASQVKKKDRMVIIDFTRRATERRFYYINLKSGAVEKHRVAHGKNSGAKGGKATSFGSKSGSYKTPAGFHVTRALGPYVAKWKSRYFLLAGIESSNRNSEAREIVAHGAKYVATGGRSNGCPALEPAIAKRLLPVLAGGVLWYHYTGK